MKHLIFLGVIFLVTLYSCLSQSQKTDSLKTIEYDFSAGKYTSNSLQKVRYNSDASLKILNINRFKYKADIKAKTWSIVTDIPDAIKAAFQLKINSDSATKNTDKAVGLMSKIVAQSRTADDLQIALDSLEIECKMYQKSIHLIQEKLAEYSLLLTLTQLDLNTQKSFLDAALPIIESILNKGVYNKFENNYNNALNAYSKAKRKASEHNKRDDLKNIEDAEAILKTNYKTLEEVTASLKDGTNKINILANRSESFQIQSFPIQVDGDEVSFDVIITDKDQTEKPTFSKSLNTFGGLRTDFSVGPLISFGKNIKDDIAYLDSKDSVSIKYRSENTTIKPSIMAMMHLTGRSAGSFTIGGMLGIGVGFKDLTTLNTNYTLGLSAVFGRLQKVFVSTGIVFQQVKRQKEGVAEKVKKGTTIDSNSFTESVYRSSPFLAVTYNIGKRK